MREVNNSFSWQSLSFQCICLSYSSQAAITKSRAFPLCAGGQKSESRWPARLSYGQGSLPGLQAPAFSLVLTRQEEGESKLSGLSYKGTNPTRKPPTLSEPSFFLKALPLLSPAGRGIQFSPQQCFFLFSVFFSFS